MPDQPTDQTLDERVAKVKGCPSKRHRRCHTCEAWVHACVSGKDRYCPSCSRTVAAENPSWSTSIGDALELWEEHEVLMYISKSDLPSGLRGYVKKAREDAPRVSVSHAGIEVDAHTRIEAARMLTEAWLARKEGE